MIMIKLLAFLFLTSCATTWAESPMIWHGSFAKSLAPIGLEQNDGKKIMILSVDPSTAGGVSAAIGTIGQRNNAGAGELWLKTAAADTSWMLVFSTGLSIGTLDSQASNANGLTLFGSVLSQQSASATNPGLVNNTTQSFSGNKTFTGSVSASNLSGTNTGDQTITLTGDVTGSGTGSFAATIANLAVTNAKIANATIDLTAKVTGILPIANGGTNSSTALNNNRVMQSSAGKIVEAAAITASRALKSDANGIPVASTATAASLDALSGNNTGDQTITLTGDVTGSGTGSFAATIANNAVTNAKAAQMAAHTIKGNNTGSTANAIDLTDTQVTAELNLFTTSLQGLVPASGGGTANFLRADGTFAAPPGTTTYAYSAINANDCASWSTTSTSFADFASDASCTLTVVVNKNMGTVTQAGGANALPGITFTPPEAGEYEFCFGLSANVQSASTNDPFALRLFDSTNSVILAESVSQKLLVGVSFSVTLTMCGIETLAASPTTVKIQGKTVAGATLSVDTYADDLAFYTIKRVH